MKYNNLILISLCISIVYLLYRDICNRKQIEKMTNTEINKEEIDNLIKDDISLIYQADIQSIRNLEKIATELQKGGLTIPGDITIKGKLNVLDSANITNDITAKELNGSIKSNSANIKNLTTSKLNSDSISSKSANIDTIKSKNANIDTIKSKNANIDTITGANCEMDNFNRLNAVVKRMIDAEYIRPGKTPKIKFNDPKSLQRQVKYNAESIKNVNEIKKYYQSN